MFLGENVNVFFWTPPAAASREFANHRAGPQLNKENMVFTMIRLKSPKNNNDAEMSTMPKAI